MRRSLLSLFILLLVALVPNIPSANPTAQFIPGAQVTPELLTTLVIHVYTDGSSRIVTDTATPWPTYTPIPSNTPIVTSTPIVTPIVTDTPEPTPTMEEPPTYTPTVTPTPSDTPVPVGKCWGVVTAGSLNVRAAPWGAILGSVKKGEILTFEAKWFLDFWWYQIYWTPTQVAYVSSNYIRLGDTADCSQLPDITPKPILQGGHILGADGANALMPYCNQMTTVKLFESVMHYAYNFRVCNPDIWIVCRFWTDAIAIETDYDAELAYQRIGRAFPNECDAVEAENEHAPTNTADWERWSRFSIDFATLMATRRNMQYLAFSLGPGWPGFDKLHYLVEYMRWVDDHPLPDRRYHGIASHASMFAPWNRPDMPWVNEPYIAGLTYLMRDWIYATTPDHFDLYEWKGVWAITEIGLSDGYSGNWSAPYTCQELKEAYWKTHAVYTEHHFPDAFQQWSYGPGGNWTDDSHCAVVIWGTSIRRGLGQFAGVIVGAVG